MKFGVLDEELEELQDPKLMKILFSAFGFNKGESRTGRFFFFLTSWEVVVADLKILF